MKNVSSNIVIFVLIVVCALLFMRTCRKDEPVDAIQVDTVFVGDTITLYKTDTLLKREIVNTVSLDTIIITDTVKILTDYFSTFRYVDSINQKDVVLQIVDLISENKIMSRTYSLQNKRQSLFVTTTIPYQPRNKIFVGGGVTLTSENIGYKANVFWMNKSDQLFGVSYHPPAGMIEFSAAFKIKLKR